MTYKIEITPELLAKLKEKAEKATPGPWVCFGLLSGNGNSSYTVGTEKPGLDICKLASQLFTKNCLCNAEYIAATNPDMVLVLIDRIERLEEENDNLIKENKCLEQNVIDIRDFCREFKCISANLADEMDADDKVFEDMVAEDEAQLDWLASQLEARDIADHYEDRLSITDMKDKTDWRKAAREAVEKENESHKSTD